MRRNWERRSCKNKANFRARSPSRGFGQQQGLVPKRIRSRLGVQISGREGALRQIRGQMSPLRCASLDMTDGARCPRNPGEVPVEPCGLNRRLLVADPVWLAAKQMRRVHRYSGRMRQVGVVGGSVGRRMEHNAVGKTSEGRLWEERVSRSLSCSWSSPSLPF